MASTLLLDRTLWDLCLDASGNIAMASEPYAIAQDVASSVRTNSGEVYYDTTLGGPYDQILGKTPPLQVVKAALVKEASRVPDVASAACYLTSNGDRGVSGQIRTTTNTGTVLTVGF